MHVVFCILDALPNRHISKELTPRLWELAAQGARSVEGGRAVMAASTYPNIRTFATGVGPSAHGVLVNADRRAPTEVPTLFSACQEAGVAIEAVLGDQELVAVMGAADADRHWPPDGVLPAGTPTCEFGYPSDAAVLDNLLDAIERRPSVLVTHINDPDTASHLYGPDSPTAIDRFRATDAVVGRLLDALAPQWDETVVIVVSDHDQETVTVPEPVDLVTDAADAGVALEVHDEGSAALVHGDAEARRWLLRHPALSGHAQVRHRERDGWLVWSFAGTWFGRPEWAGMLQGVHGSPRTQTQIAIVGGGHHAVAGLTASISGRAPHATDWAPTVAALAGVTLPGATGRSLS